MLLLVVLSNGTSHRCSYTQQIFSYVGMKFTDRTQSQWSMCNISVHNKNKGVIFTLKLE